ncbi:TPA: hypothetical protein O4I89_003566 [Vibrio cholerae]|uniref:hypothetical protein n=1 Tax=Vibrio cholerae TaxID=666 RepID=UPI0021D12D33|nr:hypothetical protein [Vibrio cholerae]MCU4193793.1 hypothetical protein [Vibrio cholerae]HCZ9566979.1 hypothetical protein [Vibrio cholerae]HCZ9570511.1 hypothetical protein [Vibrio cholerae]HCZ9581219.1 hypothetical protein [Vibrio cholerae]HCZ9584937.1 hypothetical protein [Vibrio cholerae]
MAVKKEKPKNRTIYYFRCEFTHIDGIKVKYSLEVMARAAWDKLNSTQERTFYIGDDRSVVGMKLSTRKAKLSHGDKDCTLFSVGLYEEGASANTINKPSKTSAELEAGTYDAPIDQEFLDGEGFVCIFGNHLLMSPPATFRTSAINHFLELLLDKGGYTKESSVMDIQQVADIDAVKTIEDEGVSNIAVNAVSYLSTLDYIKRMNPKEKTSGKLKKITNMVTSMLDALRDDDTDAEVLEKEGLNARIVISHDGRATGERANVGQQHAKSTAKLLASTDVGGYVITTKKGTKLTNEDTVLKHTVKVKRHGKSVDRDKMWNQLVESLVMYEREGILEQ